ncbi:lipid II:glycine glycyltransferase FemX [Denitrobaculum tricleocarpae]|uniref:GNAT family N-acetyltransferase n=1 Tax=Denitrobaculum tricleocarpae TaxID=2591009 RepID=A0A545TTJ7_9PROT|nr:GNAT family N-acetyltransferase [Denitrobaculum tricleocarpae]TQV80539.1 GNAT family N-acetyltransferase [Denitrobaculum tricleocarpae]
MMTAMVIAPKPKPEPEPEPEVGADIAWQPCPRETWDALTRQAGQSSLEQAWAYGAAIESEQGLRAERGLIVGQGGEPLALVQAFCRDRLGLRIARVLRGPIWLIDPPDDPREDPRAPAVCETIARQFRRRRFGDFLFWLPELPDTPQSAAMLRAQSLRPVVTGYSSIWLDLRSPLEALRAGLHGKWRNALRQAEKASFDVGVTTNPRRLNQSLQLYDRFRRKKRFVGPSGDFIAALAGHDRKAVVALTARLGGDQVAGVILVRHGRAATYLASWTSDDGRVGQAHNLLLWRGIETLKAGGIDWLDLGGVNTESQPGIARFKLGLGGEVFTLAGTYL